VVWSLRQLASEKDEAPGGSFSFRTALHAILTFAQVF
jgi:hypothetical protein